MWCFLNMPSLFAQLEVLVRWFFLYSTWNVLEPSDCWLGSANSLCRTAREGVHVVSWYFCVYTRASYLSILLDLRSHIHTSTPFIVSLSVLAWAPMVRKAFRLALNLELGWRQCAAVNAHLVPTRTAPHWCWLRSFFREAIYGNRPFAAFSPPFAKTYFITFWTTTALWFLLIQVKLIYYREQLLYWNTSSINACEFLLRKSPLLITTITSIAYLYPCNFILEEPPAALFHCGEVAQRLHFIFHITLPEFPTPLQATQNLAPYLRSFTTTMSLWFPVALTTPHPNCSTLHQP